MKSLHRTLTSSVPDLENRYCRNLLEELFLAYIESKGPKPVPDLSTHSWNADVIYNNSTGSVSDKNTRRVLRFAEQISTSVCAYVSHREEDRWEFDDAMAIVPQLLSSQFYWSMITDPFKKRYDKVWFYSFLITALSLFQSSNQFSLAKTIWDKILRLQVDAIRSNAPSLPFLNQYSVRPFYSDANLLSAAGSYPYNEIYEEISGIHLKILSQLSEIPETHLKILSEFTPEALYFCFKENILKMAPIVVGFIDQTFPRIEERQLQPEQDQESGEKWLGIDVAVTGEIDEVLACYDSYTDLLVKFVPAEVRYKIRFSYNII